ncbi:MAG: RecX family transcriptional regulator [Prevotella sp.]|nr:RecX family transcriptional regulator [Prevotella sp.]
MEQEINEQQALQKLMALCARAEHSSGEMLDKMRRWKLDEPVQASIMERLVSEHYVDDERYARAFVNDKITYNQWGRRRIDQALWQKGIDQDLRKKVLDEVDDETYLAVLRPLLKAKARTVKASSDYEHTMKLARFALGRGFSYDLVRRCLPDAEDMECD